MQWIKEVEMVDSVDDLKSSLSVRGNRMPDFEVLDARIAAALNRIIHNTQFKRKVSLEEQKAQKEDRFLRRRQIAYLINEYFRVTGANDSVENYADLFTVGLRNDDIQEFDSKWDRFLLSMTKVPSDDILEGLYKLRIRESEKLRTVFGCTTWRFIGRKQDLIITDWRQWWKEISSKIWEKGILGPETEIMKETQWSRIRRQSSVDKEFLEIVVNGKPTGSVQQETIAVSDAIWISGHSRIRLRVLSCNRMREMRREPEVPEEKSPSGGMFRLPCKDYLKGTCTNSFCEKWHPPECLFYKTKSGCRFGEKCSNAHRQVDEQPSKRSKKNCDKSAVAMLKKHESYDRTERPVVCNSSNTRQLGCVFQDMEPPKSSSILRKSSDMRKPIRRVKFTKAVARHAHIRDKNPSLGYICPGEPHQRSPNPPKFEDRSQEETEWQERGPAKQRGSWPKVCSK